MAIGTYGHGRPDDRDLDDESPGGQSEWRTLGGILKRRTFLKGVLASSVAGGSLSVASQQAHAQQSISSDWPMFQYDLSNTGLIPDPVGPDGDIEEVWNFATDGGVYSQPAVVDGTLYVGDDVNYLYAIDAASGEEEWRFSAGGFVGSTPAVVDDTIFVGSRDNNVYAIDTSDGDELWAVDVGGEVYTSPAVSNGVVFVGTGNGNVYALDAASGDQQWEFNAGDVSSSEQGIRANPAVSNGVVYIGGNNNLDFYALGASSGEEIWTHPLSYGLTRSPAVGSTTVYVDDSVSGSLNRKLLALNKSDGQKQWEFPTKSKLYPPSLNEPEDIVYVGDTSTSLHALSASTGEELWVIEPGLYSAISGEYLYVSSPQDIAIYDAVSGDKVAGFHLDQFRSQFTSMAVASKTIYAGNQENAIYAIDQAGQDSDDDESKISLELEDLKLVQVVSDSAVPEVMEDIPDPDIVEGKWTAILFSLDGDFSRLLELQDSGELPDVPFEVTFNNDESPTFTFHLRKDVVGNVIDQGLIQATTTSSDENNIKELFVDGENYRSFEINGKENIKVTIPDSPTIEGSSSQLVRGTDYSVSTPTVLNLGFISIRDPTNGELYGNPADGGVESYRETVDQILQYVQTAYPTNKVNGYIHTASQIEGVPIPGAFAADLQAAHDELEKLLGGGQDLTPDNELGGTLLTIEEGEVVEGGANVEIDAFDETVAIVPGGESSYFDFHGEAGTFGIHIGGDNDEGHVFHPQTSSAVLESAVFDNKNKTAEEIAGMEIAHDFLHQPFSGKFADLAAENDGTDPEHATFELSSTMIRFDDITSIRVEPNVSTFMSQDATSPLWVDKHTFQSLINSGFEAHPPEEDRIGSADLIRTIVYTIGSEGLELVRSTIRTGWPMVSSPGGDVQITVSDGSGDIIDQRSTTSTVKTSHANGEGDLNGVIISSIPFPEDTYKMSIEGEDVQLESIPLIDTLVDSVSSIPESGFDQAPEQRRQALQNKLASVENQMEEKAFRGARQRMENDFRNSIEQWLKNDFEAAANQPTKQEMLALVDDMIARLETLSQSGNPGQGRGNN